MFKTFYNKDTKARRFFFFPLFLLLLSTNLFSQTKDSLSTSVDSLKTDSTKISPKEKNSNDIDTLVTYSASDSIAFSLQSNTMEMYKKGNVKYRSMDLNAHHISMEWDSSLVIATGDTAKETLQEIQNDTSLHGESSTQQKKKQTAEDEKKQRQGLKAKLVDGGEEYYGEQLSYNFKSQKGRIILAETQIDAGYYYGEKIKRIKNDVIYVADGRYTTCNLDTPHFYFYSPKMKLVPRNRVVAEPIYLYIADAPVFALPFGVFPNKSGRRSGLIAPAYGEDGRFGRYLQHLGYYWAIDDYMDAKVTTDLFMKGSYSLAADYRYTLRYLFSGGLSGNYRSYRYNEKTDGDYSREEAYNVGINHHQEIDPTSKVDVDFRFASSNSYVLTNNYNDALRQSIESRASYSKFWENTPHSFSAAITRSQNLRDKSLSATFPSLSFSRSITYPFRSKNSTSDFKWYELIGYNYNVNASNSQSKTFEKVGGIKFNDNGIISFKTAESFSRTTNRSMSQSSSISFTPKLGYFSVSPFFNINESRSYSRNEQPKRDSLDSSLTFDTTKTWRTTGNISDGISLGTRLYGMTQPNMLGISAFRHTFSPSLSFTHSKQIYGKGAPDASMTLGFGAGNNFEMKTIPNPNDTLDKGKKIQLLNLSFSTGYDFNRDSLNFNEVGFNYNSNVADIVNIGGGGSYNLYQLDNTTKPTHRINRFYLREGKFGDLTNIRFSLSTSLSNERIKSFFEKEKVNSSTEIDSTQTNNEQNNISETEEQPVLPWSISLSWDFSQSQQGGVINGRNSSLNGSLSFSLTQNWKFSTSANYDLVSKQFVVPSINISRNLHCWAMEFSWVPTGLYRSWRFEIHILDSQLQDVKLTKSRSSRGIYD
ncbi:MAG: LPS-assembly protein LptD [Ignavibacteria bacterium]|nr:LPS-assembly protein LptD [Ignavibacteria bacterium]